MDKDQASAIAKARREEKTEADQYRVGRENGRRDVFQPGDNQPLRIRICSRFYQFDARRAKGQGEEQNYLDPPTRQKAAKGFE